MTRLLLVLLLGLFTVTASEAAMSDRTINGDPLDPRITACGVSLIGSPLTAIRPFIETSSIDLSGTLRLSVDKSGSGGTSRTMQSGRFANGSLGNIQVGVNGPARLAIDMTVLSDAGETLCRLEEEVEI